MGEHDIQSLRRIYAAFSRWDIDELESDVAHDFELSLPDSLPWGGTRHGHDGVRAFATIFQDHIEGVWADPDDFLDAGDRVVVIGLLHGHVKETGREFELGFAHVWAFSDGVAWRCRGYFDTAPITAALEGREHPTA
jgi:ketosteroid isomerase-like protein